MLILFIQGIIDQEGINNLEKKNTSNTYTEKVIIENLSNYLKLQCQNKRSQSNILKY